MSRAERLALMHALLDGLEIHTAQAELEARCGHNEWTTGDKAWLKRALERTQALQAYVANLRSKERFNAPAAAQGELEVTQ